jgi:FixJ family two-component response regulator
VHTWFGSHIHSYHFTGRGCKLICKLKEARGIDRTSPLRREVEGRILQATPVISIVDDDKAVRLALGSLIRSFGWQAHMYESAEEFLSSGQAAHTTCLISDIRMSGMSGIEMHESLRAQGHAPPTIFITAYPTPSLQAKAVSNGALVLLQKPYQPGVITHWLSVALGNP